MRSSSFNFVQINMKHLLYSIQKAYMFISSLIYCWHTTNLLARKKPQKKRLFKTVQAFCEEIVLRYLFRVFSNAESENQCWQAEKCRLHYLICIFLRFPEEKNYKNL